ncbi:MAG: hypothetical protein ABW090_03325 [Sedimenticola sp.]
MKLLEFSKNCWIFSDENTSAGDEDVLNAAIGFWQEGNIELAENLLRGLITERPNYIDAIHHLSLICSETGREYESYLCCREAVRIGFEVIPKEFDWKKSKLEWSALSNRPFMRAYHSLGLWHIVRKEIQQAIHVFNNLLLASPNDNLGVRYLLPKLWIEKGDYLSVVRHYKTFSDDVAPEILYSYPLVLALSNEEAKAKAAFSLAEKELPLVAKELRKKRHPKPKSFAEGYISHGGADQAYYYWKEYGDYWKSSKLATKIINESTKQVKK